MPKGFRDHSHTSKVSMEAKYLKIGGPDPNNPEAGEPAGLAEAVPSGTNRPQGESDEDRLLPEEQKHIFVQIAALNAMNVDDTFEFMRHFVFPEITMAQVGGLIDKYRPDVLKARDAVSLFVDRKFPYFNPLKQADIINTGLKICCTALARYADMAEREAEADEKSFADNPHGARLWEIDRNDRYVSRAARGNSIVSNTYLRWHGLMIDWGRMVDAIVQGDMPESSGTERQKLDARKISGVARGLGVEPFLADRLAQLLCYGEQKLTSDDNTVDKYFDDPKEDGDEKADAAETDRFEESVYNEKNEKDMKTEKETPAGE